MPIYHINQLILQHLITIISINIILYNMGKSFATSIGYLGILILISLTLYLLRNMTIC